MVVHPAEQHSFWRQLDEGLQGLVLLQQNHQLGEARQRDVGGKLDLDNLPHEAENQNRPGNKTTKKDNVVSIL